MRRLKPVLKQRPDKPVTKNLFLASDYQKTCTDPGALKGAAALVPMHRITFIARNMGVECVLLIGSMLAVDP
jgi:hypothetical protein